MKRCVISIMMLVGVCSAVCAQAYEIKFMTPEVQTALDARKARFAELKGLKAKGLLGENNRGYVELFGEDAAAKAILVAENKDRRVIYVTIAEQNGLGAGAINTIEAVFAGVQRKRAEAGEQIQDETGRWMKK